MLLIATATHVVSRGGASLVVVATVLELLPAVDVVDVPKTKVPLLLVVQLTGGPDIIVVNKDDEVVVLRADDEAVVLKADDEAVVLKADDEAVVLKADVEDPVGNKLADDVVLTIVAELVYPPYEAIMLLYVCCQGLVFSSRTRRFSPSSRKS
jgi:hypothetical protein